MKMKPLLIAMVALFPQVALAADYPSRPRHPRRLPARHVVEVNRVIRCTTTDLGLVTYSNCGQGFDPLSGAAGR